MVKCSYKKRDRITYISLMDNLNYLAMQLINSLILELFSCSARKGKPMTKGKREGQRDRQKQTKNDHEINPGCDQATRKDFPVQGACLRANSLPSASDTFLMNSLLVAISPYRICCISFGHHLTSVSFDHQCFWKRTLGKMLLYWRSFNLRVYF